MFASTSCLFLPTCCTQSHKALVEGVVAIARRVQGDKQLSALIRRKFAIKCTTGQLAVGSW